VNIHQAKTHLSQLLQEVEHGQEVVIARSWMPAMADPSNCRPNLTKNSRFNNSLIGATVETGFIEFAPHQSCQVK
jgi:antitoxin (DNA-binding transcriptional repressor) of toxin-antitoxin stability system